MPKFSHEAAVKITKLTENVANGWLELTSIVQKLAESAAGVTLMTAVLNGVRAALDVIPNLEGAQQMVAELVSHTEDRNLRSEMSSTIRHPLADRVRFVSVCAIRM